MQPSSLIFLVIVAIWAAYLIQHWVRRREHLATARSVDKFSEAMRVLERRAPLPTTSAATMASSSSSASTRADAADPHTVMPARPEVVVKRAAVSSPLRARAAQTATGWAHDEPVDGPLWQPSRGSIVLRRVRGVFFLLALVAVPATLVLSAVHVLKWLSVGIAAAALVASLVWLRLSARRAQALRRERRAMQRRLDERASVTPSRLQKRDVEPVPEAVVATNTVAADGSWQPVPVPRPTYTLKDPAPAPRPAATPRPQPTERTDPGRPVPIEVEDDEIEIMAEAHARRQATGS